MTAPAALAGFLAPHFAGESWARWRAVLKAMYAEPLDEAELALFREVADRDPPARPVSEAWIIAGRDAGKDSIASAIATAAAVGDYRKHLRLGERASIVCLAVDRDQARIVLRYIKGYFTEIPLLKKLVTRETEDGLEVANRAEIVVATNSFRSIRGRTVVCAILDEVAFWRDEASANPDEEVYSALQPSLARVPGSVLIGISSPYRRSGLLFRKWREAYGKADPDVLVIRGATHQFNPTIPQSVIDRAMARDPEAAAAEWLAEWRSDLADFVDRKVVEACIAPGAYERPPAAGISYAGFCDPSGGSSDAMTLAIGHADRDGRGILDAVREIRPPFSPESAVAEFAKLLKSYRLSRVTGDRYGGEWPRERFAVHGIVYEPADRPKSDLYRDLLPLLNSGRVELLDNPRLANQLCALERRTARGGRDSIDHPAGGHDDVANAAAGCLVAVAGGPVMSHRGLFEYYRQEAEKIRARQAPPAPVKEICPWAHGSVEWSEWHHKRSKSEVVQ